MSTKTPSTRSVDPTRYQVVAGRLSAVKLRDPLPDPYAVLVHSQFRGMMLSPAFPCLGGAGAVRRGEYQFGLYPALGSSEAVESCAADLKDFVADFEPGSNGVAVLVAAFDGPAFSSEEQFETALFGQLEGIHRLDETDHCGPVIDTSDDDLGFVFADRNFFVVGFHPAASRWARRFAWPTLAFNSLSHADPLRESGKFERMQGRIRDRDRRLQGTDNPTLDLPQAAQFSGRTVDDDWRPPGKFD